MRATCKTAAGNPENQDRGAVIACDSSLVLVVADGAGGRSGAAEAANLAVEFVRLHARRLKDQTACVSLLHEMDHLIARDDNAGETTCTLVVVENGRIFGAQYWRFSRLAHRRSQNGFTDLTAGQTRRPFVGLGGARPFSFSMHSKQGQRLLLATDGLLKYTSSERINAVCLEDSIDTAAVRLIELVRYPSGDLPDDITVIVAEL